jgi:asparagine synthase (glutamine-hydrolysing)
MCGISGMFAYGRQEPAVGEELMRGMAATMSHRGPDDEGCYLSADRRMGFGFRRLAIIDRSFAGHQPMSNEDGSVWIVLNGEIYNHLDLRTQLEARGHVYRGRSDTETVVHLYEEYGEECVHRLRGMFAFAIWDVRRRRLFLARDRLGIKPLYFADHGGVFVFGSEIKAVLAAGVCERRLDLEALSHYLSFAIAPAPLTLFEGIRKLPAGYRMTVTERGGVHHERYWDAIVPAAPALSDEEYGARLRQLLGESLRMRLMSDVPLGVFLSGGIDSSLLTALMAAYGKQPVETFSVGFKQYEAYNELHYARQVAHHFGTRHHEVLIDYKDALAYLPQLVHSQDEPIADWVCVPLYFLSRLVRASGVVVALVGEGADELFCGYPRYMASLAVQRWWPWLSKVPPALWASGAAACERLASAGVRAARAGERMLSLVADEGATFWGGAVVFRRAQKAALLDTPFWREHPAADSSQVPRQIYRELTRSRPDADPLQRIIYLELKQRLAELLLMRVDKITMSTAVEARVPFLDHRLVEFVLGLSLRVQTRGHQRKALLKRTFADLLPRNIVQRPKQGFSAPVAEWFRTGLAAEVRHTLLDSPLVRQGYFNAAFVRRLLDEHQSRRADRALQLWNLYNLQTWYRHWFA